MRTKDATTFTTDRGDADIPVKNVIGGTDPSKFVPNINAGRWDDEAWFNINWPVTSRIQDTLLRVNSRHWFHPVNDRVEWTRGDQRFFAYDLLGGVLETGIEFSVAPAANSIRFNLSSNNLAFHRQWRGLDGKELPKPAEDHLCDCPANVDGSYAVYLTNGHKHGKYKIGKMAHIFRWEVIDRNKQREWCILEIDAGVMTVHLPADFMRTATYPVIAMGAGDTLGYTSEPASGITYTDGQADYHGTWNPTDNGNATQMNVWGNSTSDSSDVEIILGIFSDSSGPSATLRDTAGQTITNGTKSQLGPFSLDSNLSVDTGTAYHVGCAANDGAASFRGYFDSAPGSEVLTRDASHYTGGDTFPDPTSPSTIGGFVQGFYADVVAAGGANPRSLTLLGVG